MKTRLETESARLELEAVRHTRKVQRAMLSTYQAADRGRKNRDWKAPNVSPNGALLPDLSTMTARTRQMIRDDPHAKSIVRAYLRNVIRSGILPIPQARGEDGQLLEDFNRQLMLDFWDWASDRKACDVEQRQTFWAKQQLVESERVTTGSGILIWSYDPNLDARGRIDLKRPPGLRLQNVAIEQLDCTLPGYGGNVVKGGVEVDSFNAAVAYHIHQQHPNDYPMAGLPKSIRVPADRVFCVFKVELVGQVLGQTDMHAVLSLLRDNARHREAALWRKIMESCVGLIIKQTTPSSTGRPTTILPRSSGDSTGTTPSGVETADLMPGMVARLAAGEDVTTMVPTTNSDDNETFQIGGLRAAGAGAGLGYGNVSRDYTKGTYSGQRQEMLEDRHEFEPLHELHAHGWILPVLAIFVTVSMMEGRYESFNGATAADFAMAPRRFTAADFVAPPPTWIDPEKEANALDKLLQLRVITREEIAHMRGLRFTDILDKLSKEKKAAEALGITLSEDKDDPKLEFVREAYLGFQKDGTVSDVLANQADLKQLTEDAGVPVNDEYEDPYVPVEDAGGNLVSGETITDSDDDVVGAKVIKSAPPKPPPTPDSGGPVAQGKDGSPSALSAKYAALSDDGDWITINGAHVMVKDGTVSKGPSGFVGKKPSEISSDHQPTAGEIKTSKLEKDLHQSRERTQAAKDKLDKIKSETQAIVDEHKKKIDDITSAHEAAKKAIKDKIDAANKVVSDHEKAAKSADRKGEHLSALLQSDTPPNYTLAVSQDGAAESPIRCGVCRFFDPKTLKCTAYDFTAAPDHVCDAFETPPLQGMPAAGRSVPQPPTVENPGDFSIDDRRLRGLAKAALQVELHTD